MKDILEAARREARRRLPMFSIQIAAPCDAKWEDMKGDDKTRLCGACEKNVHDLTAMSADEIASFLGNGRACVQIWKRADEKVMREDCPVGLRRVRHRAVAFSGLSLRAAAIGCFTALATLGATANATESAPVVHPSAVRTANVVKAQPGLLNVIGPSSMVISVDGVALGSGIVAVALASAVGHVVSGVDPTTGVQHAQHVQVAPGVATTIQIAPARPIQMRGDYVP